MFICLHWSCSEWPKLPDVLFSVVVVAVAVAFAVVVVVVVAVVVLVIVSLFRPKDLA